MLNGTVRGMSSFGIICLSSNDQVVANPGKENIDANTQLVS